MYSLSLAIIFLLVYYVTVLRHYSLMNVFYLSISSLRQHLEGKGLPQQAEVAQGVPDRLRPRIFLTFGTTRVVGRQPYAPLPHEKSLVLIFRG